MHYKYLYSFAKRMKLYVN